MIEIVPVSADIAETLCRKITQDLPEYFGLPDANEHYAIGVRSRLNLAAMIQAEYIGMISIDFPYPNNSNIYWMAVYRQFQSKKVGRSLIESACQLALQKGTSTITVETLSPAESDENYLNTYRFYQACGFQPLFNLKPAGYEWTMVYMIKAFDF